MTALDYWNHRFAEEADHHSQQNEAIAKSLFGLINGQTTGLGHLLIREALQSERIVEVGCGTGELTAAIRSAFQTPHLVGTDLSPNAISVAQKRHPSLIFRVYDLFDARPPFFHGDGGPHWDLAVASNTLEHFRDPHAVIDRILAFADQLLAIVPLGQQKLDGYDCEGGAGHVTSFDHTSFTRYQMVEHITFRSLGWQSDSSAMQWAVLIRPKA